LEDWWSKQHSKECERSDLAFSLREKRTPWKASVGGFGVPLQQLISYYVLLSAVSSSY
jgi:hypothetical protein